MKVKITKAKYKTLWYVSRIGEVFDVTGILDSENMYVLSKPFNSHKYIHYSDCRIVKVRNELTKAHQAVLKALSHNWIIVTNTTGERSIRRLNAAIEQMKL